ncbi:MAG: NAD(P)H-quinone oxidoreductase [candidate division Zixibacteria bacterium]|nr:NAD(P)H-quinone oxidoreductase [candidate division Zixibacteria bacterium]
MKAVGLNKFGNAEVLEYLELPDPRPKPGQVLIQVEAAGINRADIVIREGRYPVDGGFPVVPGYEVAGKIKSLGDGVKNFKPGERVCALVEIGGYAEQVCSPADLTFSVPDKLTTQEVGGVPVVFLTSWMTLFHLAKLKKDETVLIHSAGSGVGIAAIQLARQRGAKIITTAGTDEKLEKAKKLGADFAINYNKTEFSKAIKEYTQGRGVNVILDGIGGSALDGNIKSLAPLGRLVLIGTVGGLEPQLHIGRALVRNLTVYAFHIHRWASSAGTKELKQAGQEIMQMLSSGKLNSIIDKTFPFKSAAQAHKYMEERRNFGKIILTP